MPSFTSSKQLEAHIKSRMESAVRQVENRIYQVIQRYLYVFYHEYQPVESIRTWQVFNSLVKSDVVSTGSGWKAEIYFDIGKLNHLDEYIGQRGWHVKKKWTEDEILKTVMTSGTHGGTWTGVGGTAVWTESMAEAKSNEHRWIEQALIAAGIPIE